MSVSRVFGGFLLTVAAVSGAHGQTAITPEAPAAEQSAEASNPLANRAQVAPVLRFLQAKGVKLTSLGTEGGLQAYLGESPNSQMQIFYVAPDGEHVIAGLLFDTEGNNITGVQLGEMQRRFEAAQKQLGTAPPTAPGAPVKPATTSAEPKPAASATETRPPAAAPTAAPKEAQKPAATGSSDLQLPPAATGPAPAPAAQAEAPKTLADAQGILAAPAASAPAVKSEKQVAAVAPVQAATSTGSAEKWVSSLDRGAIERALGQAAWFRVGVEEAPVVYMVADPQCPFCHAAWGRMKQLVWDHKLQLRIIMISGIKGSLPKAISILARPQPGTAWFTGEGSTDGIEIQPPPAEGSAEYGAAQQALGRNAAFVRQFGLTRTPTLMYIGKDNRLYSSEGLPEDAGAFLAALN